jgi:hypothetical protein
VAIALASAGTLEGGNLSPQFKMSYNTVRRYTNVSVNVAIYLVSFVIMVELEPSLKSFSLYLSNELFELSRMWGLEHLQETLRSLS